MSLSQLTKYISKPVWVLIRHSTVAATEFVNEVPQVVEDNEYTIGVFLDLSKAFNIIDHKVLLQKLEHYGVRDIVL